MSTTTLAPESPPGRHTDVERPFRDDADFTSSVQAYADGLAMLLVAIVAAAVIAMSVGGAWSLLPFLLPVPFLARAAAVGVASSRRTRSGFQDRRTWRDAERRAVQRSFGPALRRRRFG
jgi:hypothetical protein